jgi:hypothetical protein
MSSDASTLRPHGGYRRRRSFQVTEIIYDGTVNYLLERQFVEGGGYSERLAAARLEERRRLALVLFAFDFRPMFQERDQVDQLLNGQEMIAYTHGRPSLFHRVTWGCHDCVGFDNGFSKVLLGETRVAGEIRTNRFRPKWEFFAWDTDGVTRVTLHTHKHSLAGRCQSIGKSKFPALRNFGQRGRFCGPTDTDRDE